MKLMSYYILNTLKNIKFKDNKREPGSSLFEFLGKNSSKRIRENQYENPYKYNNIFCL